MNFIRKITNVDVIEDLQRELMKERKAYQIMHNDFEMANLEAAKYKSRSHEAIKDLVILQDSHKEVATKLDVQTKYNERLSAENAQLSQELLKMRTDCENEIRKRETRYEKIIDEYHDRCVKAEGKNKPLANELEYRIKKMKHLKAETNSALERWKNEKKQLEQQKNDLKGRNIDLKEKIERLDIENRLKKEALTEVEKERVNLRKWNQQAQSKIRELEEIAKTKNDEIDDLQERVTFYEEVEDGNVHHYQAIIAKQKETIKNLKRGMKK